MKTGRVARTTVMRANFWIWPVETLSHTLGYSNIFAWADNFVRGGLRLCCCNQSPRQSPARWPGSGRRRLLSGHISGASHYLLAKKCWESSAANKTFLSSLRSAKAGSERGEIIHVWFTAGAKNSCDLSEVWAGNTVYGHVVLSRKKRSSF